MRLPRQHQIYTSLEHFGISQTSHALSTKHRIRIFLPFENVGPCGELIGQDFDQDLLLEILHSDATWYPSRLAIRKHVGLQRRRHRALPPSSYSVYRNN